MRSIVHSLTGMLLCASFRNFTAGRLTRYTSKVFEQPYGDAAHMSRNARAELNMPSLRLRLHRVHVKKDSPPDDSLEMIARQSTKLEILRFGKRILEIFE